MRKIEKKIGFKRSKKLKRSREQSTKVILVQPMKNYKSPTYKNLYIKKKRYFIHLKAKEA